MEAAQVSFSRWVDKTTVGHLHNGKDVLYTTSSPATPCLQPLHFPSTPTSVISCSVHVQTFESKGQDPHSRLIIEHKMSWRISRNSPKLPREICLSHISCPLLQLCHESLHILKDLFPWEDFFLPLLLYFQL